jgi:hypothetical protein
MSHPGEHLPPTFCTLFRGGRLLGEHDKTVLKINDVKFSDLENKVLT